VAYIETFPSIFLEELRKTARMPMRISGLGLMIRAAFGCECGSGNG
jgi:hypothetical protein